jgi:hypothetical protein
VARSSSDRVGWRLFRRPTRLARHGRVLLLAAAAVAVCSAAAGAYWTGSGSGSATTVLPDPHSLSLAPGIPTAQLYPGDDASVAIVASNPNSYFLHIGSMRLDTAGQPFAVDAAHSGCDVSVLSFVTDDNGGLGWDIPPKVGAVDGTLTIDMAAAMRMTSAAANACQGATFTVRLVADN